ncbi:urease accessory protein UreD [Amaricoccus solimangrovi]|uniref:Urease accessory protein UreD n=1 Tax=Amaricoccus solimangrovi TaxID=2589815 RepID=A0A501WXY7_9RHOB|nr:urease accessory protein UreD [Amaricoccus solimangrovi]TPE53115.1 urease accessory protein UreD [Amaricoccus solimangrovi]
MQMRPPPLRLQRAQGRAEVAMEVSRGASRLRRLYQEGCAKALLPRAHGPTPEAILINTSGGITGGDRLAYAAAVGARAELTVTTQAAERIYRSTGEAGTLDVTLSVGPGARLDWLPQETILFEGGRLVRRLSAEMAEDARLTLLETVVLGRAAMGETLRDASITDHWRISRGGRLVHAEALRLGPDITVGSRGRATLGGARAFATLVHLAPGAEDRLGEVRALLAGVDLQAAASAKPGILILRFLAPDAAPLREALFRLLMGFRGTPLPRVWSL